MAEIKLITEGTYKFVDISYQEYRTYQYRASEITINKPAFLNVGKNGGHNILDEAGVSHYIPKKWLKVSWKSKEGNPHFKR